MEEKDFLVSNGEHYSRASPFVGQILSMSPEDGNEHDPHAVLICAIVGHAPCELSRVFFFFLRHNGTITAEITGHRRFGCGLEVPCLYTLTGKPKYIKKAKKLIY